MSNMSSTPPDYLTALQTAIIGMAKWKPIADKILVKAKALITYDWLVRAVLNGEFTFMHNETAFMFVKPEQYPLGSRLYIYAAGGDCKGLILLQEELETWAYENNVKQIVAMTRIGFKKWPKQEGWRDTRHLWIMKEL